jgi:Kef-type K+ transport system membrane component KefB
LKKIVIYSILICLGLVFSQFLPLIGGENYLRVGFVVKQLTMIALAFIMIHVGLEFSIAKGRLAEYGKDYFVAFTTATLPWIFCSIYFVYFLPHNETLTSYQIWTESLLIGRFAAPTSAGVLFTMLAGVGLAHTWLFRKTRILAIFDDLDTILLMIPLKILLVGMKWELFVVIIFLVSLLIFAWKKLHRISLPLGWRWILLYSIITVVFCELVYVFTNSMNGVMSIHLEVLLPAFVWGCVLAYPDQDEKKLHTLLERPSEKRIQFNISALFMLLVGLSMPPVLLDVAAFQNLENRGWMEVIVESPQLIFRSNGSLPFSSLIIHAFTVTCIANLGKMFPLFCYRDKASLRERFALCLGMCCRGEVGAGILVVSLSLVTYAKSATITIAMLALVLNFLLIGPIIGVIKWLTASKIDRSI